MPEKTRLARRGALSALVVTLLVAVAILLGQILVGMLSLVQGASFGVPVPQMFASSAVLVLSAAGLTTLPLAIGVFLSLWQLAPIGAELRVTHVLSRSTLAAGVGAALALVVSAIGGVVETVIRVGIPEFAQQVPFALGTALITAVSAFLGALPLVALGSVLFWVRLRDVDRDYRVEGMLDL